MAEPPLFPVLHGELLQTHSDIVVASLSLLTRYLTMQCMVDVVLESATPDDEALKSPRQQRWCEGKRQNTVAFDGRDRQTSLLLL